MNNRQLLDIAVHSIEHAETPAVVFEPRGRIAYANEPFKRIWGIDHVVGAHAPALSPTFSEILTEIRNRRAAFAMEIDANQIGYGYIETLSLPYYHDEQLTYIVTFATELPSVPPEAELAYARRLIPDGENICILREDLTLVACEVDDKSLFYGRETAQQDLTEVIHEDDMLIFMRAMEQAKGAESPATFEFRALRKDGIERLGAMLAYTNERMPRWVLGTTPLSPLGGRIITRLREAWGASNVAELARCMGLSRSTVTRYRTKDHVPAEWLIETYLRRRVSVHWLYTGHGPRFISEP
jgi:hypothetical protein